MGLISMDFQSVVIGYAVGVALMWSLNELLYGDNNEQRTETDSEHTRPTDRDWETILINPMILPPIVLRNHHLRTNPVPRHIM